MPGGTMGGADRSPAPDLTPAVVVCHRPPDDSALLQSALRTHGIASVATTSADVAAHRCQQVHPTPLLVAEIDRLRKLAPVLLRGAECRPLALALVDDDSQSLTLEAFRAGADAVLTRPFDSAVFVAQAEALLLRDRARQERLSFRGFTLDLVREVLLRGTKEVHLTPTEFALLSRLARERDGTVTKAELRRAVWGHGYVASDTLHVHLSALRRKLHRFEPGLVETLRGRGYRLRPGDL